MSQNSLDNNKDSRPTQPEQTATQNSESTTEEKKGAPWQIIITIIAIIAIIFIFALPDHKKDEGDSMSETDTGVTEEEGALTNEEVRAGANSGPTTEASPMTPISIDDEFVYSFSGIDWFLEPVDGGTAVQFKFSEFSRRKGSIVAFGNPYRLGVFPGKCAEEKSLYVGKITDTLLSHVSCRTESNSGNDIALFQDGAKVYAVQREVTDSKVGDFYEFFSRDITTIVK